MVLPELQIQVVVAVAAGDLLVPAEQVAPVS
jgi:hypothetical protein